MDWLGILHLTDSAFPIGTHAHSFGLETLAPSGRAEFEAALVERIQQSLAQFELVFVLQASAGKHDLRALDALLHAMLLPHESRTASALLGTHLLRATCDILEDDRLEAYLDSDAHHHHAVVFGAVLATLDVEPRMVGEAYAFGVVRSLVSAAQRLGWVGQYDAQRILHALKPTIRAAVVTASHLDLAEAGCFAPDWDIASMAHEWAPQRLFAS